jgi:hypothetical protein
MREIWSWGNYRIIEVEDTTYCVEDLLGDVYCPKANPDIDIQELKRQEKKERERIAEEGVYGYRLIQLIHCDHCKTCQECELDACYGFVGQYSEGDHLYDHDIIDEMKGIASKRGGEY